MDDLEDGYAYGLDLGTTFSCIGVFRNGGVEIIPNRNGDKTTPSIVTVIDEDTILRGEETEDHLVKDYDSSIYDIKRFIGRDFKDQNIKEEINFENFPFDLIQDEKSNYPLINIKKNNQKIQFKLEEISSFIIRKMVESAEDFLQRSVNKLVITVPANFNDSQRKCTEQAAKMAGIDVLRIINEPTAAALAYGLQDQNINNNGKILIFDLGGGTFDVTILNINKEKNLEQIFEILSTNGDKFLGGEDFDNKLVEYFLDKFCEKMGLNKNEIKKDKKAIRRLKIACEKIKRVLSSSKETQLCLNHFYDNKDILEKISANKFNDLCKDLIKRLENPIKNALIDAKITKKEISEIILVGGSTRLPMVKSFLFNNFKGCKINDSINPDETVAYGATLMAAKILLKDNNLISNFNLMDITPLSLGVEIYNDSKDKEIQKEGAKMSVIIKRGSKIPYKNSKLYYTCFDNQKEASIVIYEGEKKYVKYNHKLGYVLMTGLSQKPRGQVCIKIEFFIDSNGILTIKGIEENKDNSNDNSVKCEIKNDSVSLTPEVIEKLREKNEKYINVNHELSLDYSNLKASLRDLKESYKTCDDDTEKYNVLMNYNNTLEEFIDSFNKEFDNETMIEKYHIYVKELFNSYCKTLKMKDIDNETQKNIINKCKEYIAQFIEKCSGYLIDLVEGIKDFPKKYFYEIIVFIMEKYNECGKKCLKDKQKFCRYNSLLYFEKTLMFCKKYITDMKDILKVCQKKIFENCKRQFDISRVYIEDINSNAILLCSDSLKLGKLIVSGEGTGFTEKAKGLKYGVQEEQEKYEIVLQNYEKMFANLKGKTNEEEAICIANIIKINYKCLGNDNYKNYLKLGENCEFIARKIKIDPKKEWYEEFKEIIKEIKNEYKETTKEETREIIKEKYKDKFDEIDEKFAKKKNAMDFIQYILKINPYPEYEEDKNNKDINFNEESQELLKLLTKRYFPKTYEIDNNDEQYQLNYFINEEIEAYLNNLYQNIQ